MNDAPDFLADVVEHLRTFAEAQQIAMSDVLVQVMLTDGSTWRISNLGASPAIGAGRWGMLVQENEAVVVRESHVVNVKFQLLEDDHPPIGFHAESNP